MCGMISRYLLWCLGCAALFLPWVTHDRAVQDGDEAMD
jgi:hypothetical protein